MNYKQFSTLFTTVLLLLSTLPAVLPTNVVQDQGNFAAALITELSDSLSEEIFVQYLGSRNPARIHGMYFDDLCVEDPFIAFDSGDISPLTIVSIPDVPGDQKLIIVVEDSGGTILVNEPLAGVKYIEGRTAWQHLSGITAPIAIAPGATIGPVGSLDFTGGAYGLFAKDFIYLPFLTEGTPLTPDVINNLAINIFMPGVGSLDVAAFNDNEDQDLSSSISGLDCAGLTDLSGFPFDFVSIGVSGIPGGEGLPPPSTINAGVGVITSTGGTATFAEAFLDVTTAGATPGPYFSAANVFFVDQGAPVVLPFAALPSLPPTGIFTGRNENYQNPNPASARAEQAQHNYFDSPRLHSLLQYLLVFVVLVNRLRIGSLALENMFLMAHSQVQRT